MKIGTKIVGSLLADYANSTNNLLNVVGGGINTLWRTSFPAALDCYLAVLVEMPAEYDGSSVPVSFTVGSLENEDVYARVDGEFTGSPTSADAVASVTPLILDLRQVAVPRPGKFLVAVSAGNAKSRVQFQVVRSEIEFAQPQDEGAEPPPA